MAAAVNIMNPSIRAAAVASGDSALVTSLAVAQGKQSQISSWATSAALFRDLAGYIFSVLQAFIIGIAPIVLAVTVVPGAGKRILLSYSQVLLWLALWDPTMSIINYIVSLYGQGELGPTLGSTGGFSMMNQGVITQMTSNMELAAGFLASTVPLITWGLVKGGLAFTDFVVGAVGSSFATTAGAMAATGNVSLGNFSMDNQTMNQAMLARKETAGQAQDVVSTAGEFDTMNYNIGGHVTKAPTGDIKGQITAADAAAAAHDLSMSRGFATSAEKNAGIANSVGAELVASNMTNSTSGAALDHGTGTSKSGSENITGSQMFKGAMSSLASQNVSQKAARDYGAAWGAKIGNPKERQQAAAAADNEANNTNNAAKASRLRSWASGVLGGMGAEASLGGHTGISEDTSGNASKSESGEHGFSGGTSMDAKTAAQVSQLWRHNIAYAQQHGFGTTGKDGQMANEALSASERATQDYKKSVSYKRSASLAVSYTMPTSTTSNFGVGSNRAALAELEARLRREGANITEGTDAGLNRGQSVTNQADKAAAHAREIIATSPPPPSASKVLHKAQAGFNADAGAVHTGHSALTKKANKRITNDKAGAENYANVAHQLYNNALAEYSGEAAQTSASMSSFVPTVATGYDPYGPSDWTITKLGGAYMASAAVANYLKNLARNAIGPGKPGAQEGGEGGGGGSPGGDGGNSKGSGEPADDATSSNGSGVTPQFENKVENDFEFGPSDGAGDMDVPLIE